MLPVVNSGLVVLMVKGQLGPVLARRLVLVPVPISAPVPDPGVARMFQLPPFAHRARGASIAH